MNQTAISGVARRSPPKAPGGAGPLLVGLGVLFAGYLTAFATTLNQPLIASVGFAAINTLSVCVPAVLFRPVMHRLAAGARVPLAILVQPLLAAAFSVAWNFCTLAGFALSPNWPNEGFTVARSVRSR